VGEEIENVGDVAEDDGDKDGGGGKSALVGFGGLNVSLMTFAGR